MKQYCPNNSNYTFRKICCEKPPKHKKDFWDENIFCDHNKPPFLNFPFPPINIAPPKECNFDMRLFLIGYLVGSICPNEPTHPRYFE